MDTKDENKDLQGRATLTKRIPDTTYHLEGTKPKTGGTQERQKE
jgi:hypothetical protein